MTETLKNIKIMFFCSYGCKLICVDEQYSRSYKSYFVEDAVGKFNCDITNEKEYRHRLFERNVNKPLVMTVKNYKGFKSYVKLCKRRRCQSKR